MSSDLLGALEDVKGPWMVGGSALRNAPSSWQSAAENDPQPDLALLAVAGQALQIGLQPVPGGELQGLAPLPRLSSPTPPPQARLQIRRLAQVNKLAEAQVATVIRFLAARGYSVHPIDYMPKRFQQLPDIYAPWASWQSAAGVDDESSDLETITAENWDGWMPAERRMALSQLRREQPEEARQLIAEKAPSLSAEERLRIIQSLGEELGPEDQSLLEGFASDRSGKVRQLVTQFLARMGAVDDDAADIAEYADFFAAAKKRLRGGHKITPNRLKTKAQRTRRGELAAKLSLQSLVKGLKLTSELDLIDGWEHTEDDASDELVRMVAATGSDQATRALASRIASLDGVSVEAFTALLDRLDNDGRRELLPRVLQNEDASFSATVICSQGFWGEMPLGQLTNLRAFKQLRKLVGDHASNDGMRQETCRQGLFSLGLLVDQSAAAELISLFTNAGLFSSDPMLGLLKLNECLPPGELP